MSEQPKTITRAELYEEIWRTPMSKLAAAWGVHFTSIVSACHELEVPRPASNHWQLVRLGRQVAREPMPPPSPKTPVLATLSRIWRAESTDDQQRVEPVEKSVNGGVNHAPEDGTDDQPAETLIRNRGATSGLLLQPNARSAFNKIRKAFDLIQEALHECPSLEVLQLEPMLSGLGEGLRILDQRDNELDLSSLMLKHGWHVGQQFYSRAVVQSPSGSLFTVLPGQDLPEGVIVEGKRHHPELREGEHVALLLKIERRARRRAVWKIAAIDRV